MRFKAVDLIAFGHFTNASLTFSPRRGVVEIVYGDNEAGKSTSLRALTSFLYGIPARTTDDFVHQMPTLRVGATVLDEDGNPAAYIRRKGLKDTLRDINDVPVGGDLIERLLGGLDRDLFEQMYALSREQLQRGATDLLTGNGSLGEALFGASLGLTGINDVLKRLEEEAAKIFRPTGHNPTLNSLISDFESLRKRARGAELRPSDYQALQNDLKRVVAERDEVDGELTVIEASLQRARRNEQLIPLAALRAQLLGELETHRGTRPLATTARDDRISAERDLEQAASEIETGGRKVAEFVERLSGLTPAAPLLARADQIRDLHKSISAHQKAADDLPGIKTSYRQAIEEAEAILRETHPDRTIANVKDLRPSAVVRAAINDLSDEHVRLTESRRVAANAVDEARRRLARACAHTDSLPEPFDVATVRAALRAARKLGDIEAELATDATTLRVLDEQLAADIAAFGFLGAAADLEALPFPGEATVSRFVKNEVEHGADKSRVEVQRRLLEERLVDERQTLAALDRSGSVPTESDLENSRARRDAQWHVVRAALVGLAPEVDSEGKRAAGDAYEPYVRSADAIADRLRREADAVATKASLEATIGRLENELEDATGELARLDAALADLQKEWCELWMPTKITPRSAVEMRDWLSIRSRIVEAARSLRLDRGRYEGRVGSIASHRAPLADAVQAAGCTVSEETSLATMIGLAEQLVEEHAGRTAALKSARERVTELEHREREAVDALAKAVAGLEQWQLRWTSEVEKLEVDPGMKPERVREIIEAMERMFILLTAAAKEAGRINGIERDSRMFQKSVAEIVNEVAPTLATVPEGEAATTLQHMVAAAQSEATQVEAINAQVAELEAFVELASTRQLAAQRQLERLVKSAGCSTPEALPAAEERSVELIELRGRLAVAEEKMTMLAGATPEEIVKQLEAVDLERVGITLHELEQQRRDLTPRRKVVGEEVGEKRTLLAAMNGGDDAAELYAEAESVKASIRAQSEQYARLRIAASILRRQIEEYRERSHGPLLTRASYFFAKLTCGKCVGLGTGFDDKGNVVLLARRKNGAEVTVDRMSTGTRDQLYLALRLATLEQQAQRTDPLPLLVDDLFEGYDDNRAAAGFEALAEVAEETQVVFFTHHRHLVEIAKQTLQDRCAVQELRDSAAASAEAA